MIYDTFVLLCKDKGLSPIRAALEAQISKSLVTKWKTNGTEVPSPEVLKKLSDFFGVTPNDLLGYETSRWETTELEVDAKEENEMAKRTTPVITHTEILSRAIRSIEADIDDLHKKCEDIPQPQRNALLAASTEELRGKLAALKALYGIETGTEYV